MTRLQSKWAFSVELNYKIRKSEMKTKTKTLKLFELTALEKRMIIKYLCLCSQVFPQIAAKFHGEENSSV